MANETENSASAAAQREIEDLRRRLKDLTDKYGPTAQSAVEDIEKQIREKPVQATLIAAGVGFLLGALLTR
ncbi:MAG: YqjD family protein [Rhodomicrobium sp.]